MNWSGHGIIDLPSYEAFMSGKLTDYCDVRRGDCRIGERPKQVPKACLAHR
jgi:hypothetical protein